MHIDIALPLVALIATNVMLVLEFKAPSWEKLRRLFKAAASVCYLVAFLYWSEGLNLNSALVLLATTFALVGDQYMIRTDKPGHLMIATWFFIWQHLFYVCALSSYARQDILLLWSVVAVVAFIGLIVLFLLPHLQGAFRLLVPAYAAAISANLVVSISVATHYDNSLLLAGISLFLVGDLFVAANRFIAPHWFNRVADSNVYILGQFAILYGASHLIG